MTVGPDLPRDGSVLGLPTREGMTAVITRYADRAADAARRLGASPEQARVVVERGAVAVLDDAATNPRAAGDLGGRWFREIRALVNGLRAEGLIATPGPRRKGAKAKVAPDPLEDALASLDERRLLALLLRDSYDLPYPSVAAGLALSIDDAATVVAEARLRLLEALDGAPAPTLAGHPAASGISFGALGRHSDGSLGTEDPHYAARLRHVQTCGVCAAFVEAQRRTRRAVAGLHVKALDDAEHDALVTRMDAMAASRLPAQSRVLAAVAAAAPAVGPSLVTVGVIGALAAVLIGAAIGVATASGDDGGSSSLRVSPSSGPTLGFASASPSPSSAPSPVPSSTPGPVGSPTPSPVTSRRASPRPAVVTTTAAPPTSPTPAPTSDAATVPAGISLSPTSGPNNTQIDVTGVGFTPGSTVTATFDAGGLTSTGSATVTSSGTFSTTVVSREPLGLPTDGTVTASDGTHQASADFHGT